VFPFLYAQTAAAPAGGGSAMMIQMVVMMAVVVGVMYFTSIGPQRKREKERREMLAAIAKGDSIVTIGGAVGTVYQVSENHVVVELDRDVRVKFERAAIGRVEKKSS
jgi:preprotein translocase subunit YajC